MLEPYDGRLVPPPFGLHNTGAICYLNSFLQVLAGCTAFTRAALRAAARLGQTRTGAALVEFCRAYTADGGAEAQGAATLARVPGAAVAGASAAVLGALMADLRERVVGDRIGAGQMCTHEFISQFLDMAAAPGDGGSDVRGSAVASIWANPAAQPFAYRYKCRTLCVPCRAFVSERADTGVVIELYDYDRLKPPPASPAEFAAAVRRPVERVEDFECPRCRGREPKARVYSLTSAPEVILVMFNMFDRYGGARRARYFPEAFDLPGAAGGRLGYLLVGQIEQSGGMGGGHYWARCRRAGGVYALNDSGVAPAAFGPSANTFFLAYHYIGTSDAPPQN